jgi:hypothetical protein
MRKKKDKNKSKESWKDKNKKKERKSKKKKKKTKKKKLESDCFHYCEYIIIGIINIINIYMRLLSYVLLILNL